MGTSIHVDENTQAGRVIKKFGNARRLAEMLSAATGAKVNPSRVYRWMHPRAKGGSGGLIPSSAMQDVMACARLAGIVLTSEDLYPKAKAPADQDIDQTAEVVQA